MSGPLDRLTVLVPTRNRYPRLLRLLRYLASAKPALRVVVLDGSSDETDLGVLDAAVVSAGAQYRRFGPEVSLMAKIVSGLESVETEYVVWLADDDFTVPRTWLTKVLRALTRAARLRRTAKSARVSGERWRKP